MKTKGFTMILLLVCFFVLVSFCYAAKVRVVEGLIENVIGDSIEVRGEYYNLSGVPLTNSSGENVRKDMLKVGKKVEIFFKDDLITRVVIHGYLVD